MGSSHTDSDPKAEETVILGRAVHHGLEKDSEGAARPRCRSSCQLFGWTGWRRHVQLAGDDHGSSGLGIHRRGLLSEHQLPVGLPIQAAKGALHDQTAREWVQKYAV